MNRCDNLRCARVFVWAYMAALVLVPRPGYGDEESWRTILFRVYPIDDADLRNLVYLETPETFTPLIARPYARSRPFSYRGPDPLVFYRSADIAGEPPHRPVAAIDLPDGVSNLLLFLLPGKQIESGSTRIRIVATDDSHRALPPDHLRFVNGTGRELSGIFGERPLRLAPGGTRVVPVSRWRGKEVPVALAAHHRGAWRPVLQNRWRFYRGNRTVILLLPPRDSKSLRIRAYRISEYIHSGEEPDH